MEEDQLINECKLLLIGGSAGSLTVLFQLLPSLKTHVNFAIVLVLHRKNSGDSSLSDLLSIKSTIPVKEIDDKDLIRPGNIYLAPADYHVLIERDKSFSLDDSEKVNFSRPSLDVTFESAAEVYGPHLTAIILSGANEDGTQGMLAIKKAGGKLVAQSPISAQMPVMPQNAITRNQIEIVLMPEEISKYIGSINEV
jgi:two-component system chemotaxis response regulator CheB